MPLKVIRGSPGKSWSNDTGKVAYQFFVAGNNTCGLCYQFDRAISENSWPIPLHFGCLLPGTCVVAPEALAGIEVWYDGPIRALTFEDGSTVRLTPNHMLLTPTGFAPAQALREGDNVIRGRWAERVGFGGPDDDDRPTPIDEVVHSLAISSGVRSIRVPVATEDLHGDGGHSQGEIRVVSTDRELLNNRLAALGDPDGELDFQVTDSTGVGLTRKGELLALLLGVRDATDGGASALREAKALLWRRDCHPPKHRLATVANRSAHGLDGGLQRRSRHAEPLGHRLEGFAGLVCLACRERVKHLGSVANPVNLGHRARRDGLFGEATFDDDGRDAKRIRDVALRFPGQITTRDVIRVETVHYRGPVFDVQTTSTLYLLKNGVVSSNCRCRQELVYPNASAQPFVDFRETIRNLDEAQRGAVVGRTNLRLIESGVVRWEDVVTESRVRDLTEVASLKGLSAKQLTKAGLPASRARAVHQAAQSGPQRAADESRRRILAALEQRGVDATRVRELASQRLAARVGARRIEEGGAGAVVMAPVRPTAPPPLLTALAIPPPSPPSRLKSFTVQGDPASYEEAAKAAFGRVPTADELASLAGAVDGSEVIVKSYQGMDLKVTWQTDHAEATRRFHRDDNGKLVIRADYFEVAKKQRGQGIGRESFGRMVEAGVKMGADRIETTAARAPDQIGYRVWPLFGYDGTIPWVLQRKLPENLGGANKLSDLMATEEGRAWWTKHGGTTNLTFSLKPRSRSMRIWNAYRAAKAAISPTSRGRTKP